MRHLSHTRKRYLDTALNYSGFYTYSDKKEQLVESTGVLNFIWNSWNNFWREYWLTHVCGGYDFNDVPLLPIFTNYRDKEAIHYLLYLTGKRKSHSRGDIISGGYQEPTWGDADKIVDISSALLASHSVTHGHLSTTLALVSSYVTELKHFQKIRNTFIHLNNENINSLNAISGYYSFGSSYRLIDILEATYIPNSVRCFDNLIDNSMGLLLSL